MHRHGFAWRGLSAQRVSVITTSCHHHHRPLHTTVTITIITAVRVSGQRAGTGQVGLGREGTVEEHSLPYQPCLLLLAATGTSPWAFWTQDRLWAGFWGTWGLRFGICSWALPICSSSPTSKHSFDWRATGLGDENTGPDPRSLGYQVTPDDIGVPREASGLHGL